MIEQAVVLTLIATLLQPHGYVSFTEGPTHSYGLAQSGVIHAYPNSETLATATPTTLYSFPPDVLSSHPEAGALDLALSPNFAEDGRAWVTYVCNTTSTHPMCAPPCSASSDCPYLSTCSTSSSTCRPSSGGFTFSVVSDFVFALNNATGKRDGPVSFVRPFVFVTQTDYNHNTNQLQFDLTDPEGRTVYINSGDAGSGAGDYLSQDLSPGAFQGKILRVRVNNLTDPEPYTPHPDNPFPSSPEVFALGLRNPWRCSQDAYYPGALICGDVGQSEVEEVNILRAGQNAGWPVYEGQSRYSGHDVMNPAAPTHTEPVASYQHFTRGNSICGGFFLRNTSAFPTLPENTYVYADYFSGILASQEIGEPGSGSLTPPVFLNVSNVRSLFPIYSFSLHNQGSELYVNSARGLFSLTPAPPSPPSSSSSSSLSSSSSPASDSSTSRAVIIVLSSLFLLSLILLALFSIHRYGCGPPSY